MSTLNHNIDWLTQLVNRVNWAYTSIAVAIGTATVFLKKWIFPPCRKVWKKIRPAAGMYGMMDEQNLVIAELRKVLSHVMASLDRQYILVTACLDQFLVIHWTTDPNGDRDFTSQEWQRLTGYPVTRALGDGWLRYVHEDDRERVRRAWHEALESKEPFQATMRYTCADGSVTEMMEMTGDPYKDSQGVVTWKGTSQKANKHISP